MSVNRRIQIDVVANAGNVPATMQNIASSVNGAGTSFQKLTPAIQGTSQQLTAIGTPIAKISTGVQKFGTETEVAGKKTASFGQKFADNRGIVFGVAGLSSALAEAVGMMGMYGDTQERLKESQDALNKLVDAGVTSGKEYTDAQNEVNKQMRFSNMVNRNTALSLMDNVFFLTMVVSGLQKSGIGWSKLGSIVGKVGGIFSGFGKQAQTIGGALPSISIGFDKAGVSADKFSKGLHSGNTLMATGSKATSSFGSTLMSLAPAFAVAAAGAVVIALVIQKVEEMNKAVKDASGAMTINMSSAEHAYLSFLDTLGKLSKADKERLDAFNQQQKDFEAAAKKMGMSLNAALKPENLDDFKMALFEIRNGVAATAEKMQEMNKTAVSTAFSEELEAQAQLLKMVQPLAQKMINDMIAKNQVSEAGIATAERVIDQMVEEGTLLESEGEIMKNLVSEGIQPMLDAFDELVEKWKEQASILPTVEERMAGIIKGVTEGVPQAVTFLTAVVSVTDKWTEANKNALPAMRAVGGDVAALRAHLTTFFDQFLDGPALIAAVEFGLQHYATKTETAGKASKTAAKDVQTFGDAMAKLSQTADFKIANFWEQVSTGAPQAISDLTDIVDITDQWIETNKNAIPVLEAEGQTTDVFLNHIRSLIPATTDAAVAEAFLTVAAAVLEGKLESAKGSTESLTAATSENQKAFEESAKALQLVGIHHTQNTETNEILLSSYGDLVGGIIEEGKAIETTRMIEQQLNTVRDEGTKKILDLVKLSQELQLAEAKRIPILEDSIRGEIARAEAIEEGVQAFSDELGAIEQNNIALTTNRREWVALINDMNLGINTNSMLTDELIELATLGLDRTTDSVIALKREMEGFRDNAIGSLGLFDTESSKEFNEAWKELDLGSIPDNLKDDFKDVTKEMRPMAERGREVSTALNLIVASGDKLSEKDYAKTFEEIRKDFEKFQEFDPEAMALNNMPGLMDFITDSANRNTDATLAWTEAMQDNNIESDEANKIRALYLLNSGKLEQANTKNLDYLVEAGFLTQAQADAIANTNEEVNKYTEEMAKVEVTAIVVKTIGDMWANLAKMIIEANLVLVENWSNTLIVSAEMFANMIIEMAKAWAAFVEGLHKMNVAAANSWEKAMKNILHNSQAASSQSQSEFASMVKKLNSSFVKVANNWEKAMKNVVHNAKAAASQVNAALAKIKDKTVTITYVKKGSPQSEGGIHSFENGGMISAASGLYTTNSLAQFGPFQYGDNSGARETIAFLPHDGNKADDIMDQLDVMFGRRRNMTLIGGGDANDRMIVVPITLNINGEQYSFTQTYRVRQGQEIASQVF